MYGTKNLGLSRSLANIWKWAVEEELGSKPHPFRSHDLKGLSEWEPYQVIGEFFTLLQEQLQDQEALTNEIPPGPYKTLGVAVGRAARKLPESFIADLWIAVGYLELENLRQEDMPGWEDMDGWHDVMKLFAKTVHILTGSETRLLIGTRDQIPVWLELRPRVQNLDEWSDLANSSFFEDAALLPFIGQDEASLIPLPKDWIPATKSQEMFRSLPVVERSVIERIFEQAYYNQYFTPHVDGMVVRIQGHPWVTQLALKVKRGVQDENYYDFLVRLETRDGELAYPLNGASITRDIATILVSSGSSDYLDLLIGQVYHDLVTVRKQRVEGGGIALLGSQPKPKELDGLSWIYIPRTYRRKDNAEVRTISTSGGTRQPHRVQGHPRKGNMSDTHREEIRKFETETGLAVLRHLPEGFTYVRPHVSPLSSTGEIKHLPRFVRTRLQNDLIRLMQK